MAVEVVGIGEGVDGEMSHTQILVSKIPEVLPSAKHMYAVNQGPLHIKNHKEDRLGKRFSIQRNSKKGIVGSFCVWFCFVRGFGPFQFRL